MKARMIAVLFICLLILALSACAITVSAPAPESDDALFTYAPTTENETTVSTSNETTPEISADITSLTNEPVSDPITEETLIQTDPPETLVINHYVGGGSIWSNEPDDTFLITSVTEIVEPPRETDAQHSERPRETAVTETEEVTSFYVEADTTADTEKQAGEYSTVALMYHSINEEPFTSLTSLFVKPNDFEDHLATLNSMKYEYVFADEFQTSDRPTVMLTFDDGYEDNYTEMFPILKKYHAKATIFMVTSKIDTAGYLSREQIREMAESGLVRFASHTHDHLALTSLSEEALRYQFETSKNILTELTGYEMNAICYPGGSVTDLVATVAKDYFDFGYTTVSSSYTLGCDPMLIPRVRVSRGVSGYGLASLIK